MFNLREWESIVESDLPPTLAKSAPSPGKEGSRLRASHATESHTGMMARDGRYAAASTSPTHP
jgi:hypothetical protein